MIINLTILFAFYRLSQKLSTKATKLVARSLQDYSKEDSLILYREEAAKSMEELIDSMMTIKVSDESIVLKTLDNS